MSTRLSNDGQLSRVARHAAGPRLPLIGVGSVATMTMLARDHGVSRERILHGSGISAQTLDDADLTIHISQEITVARNLIAAVDDPVGLGITLAQRYRVTTYGAFGWGLLCAPTLREQLAFAARFFDLSYACCQISWHELNGRLQMRIGDAGLPPDVRDFFRDRTMACIVTLLRDTQPEPEVLEAVKLARPEPADSTVYRNCFRAPVSFGQPANELLFRLERLDERTPTASELGFAEAQRHCTELLERRRHRCTIGDRVQQHLLRCLPVVPTIAEIAAGLHISERTLRRQLEDEKTSFSEILDSTRRSLAGELLSRGTPPSRVATSLGFSSHSSFTHAFNRWYGRTPREFMVANLEPAGSKYSCELAARSF
jgi:AraC-like DNA-binding protein